MGILFFCGFQATESSSSPASEPLLRAQIVHLPWSCWASLWPHGKAAKPRRRDACPDQAHDQGGTSTTTAAGRPDKVVQAQENSTALFSHLKHFTNELYKNKSKWHGIKPQAGKRLKEKKNNKSGFITQALWTLFRIDLLLQHFSATRINSCIRQNIHQSHTWGTAGSSHGLSSSHSPGTGSQWGGPNCSLVPCTQIGHMKLTMKPEQLSTLIGLKSAFL